MFARLCPNGMGGGDPARGGVAIAASVGRSGFFLAAYQAHRTRYAEVAPWIWRAMKAVVGPAQSCSVPCSGPPMSGRPRRSCRRRGQGR